MSDQDMQRRMEKYRQWHAWGIYPDPATMGYRDERDRQRDMVALAAVLREEAGQVTGSNVDVVMGDVVRELTMVVRVHGRTWTERRLRVAMLVFRFGVWVGGFGGVEFEAAELPLFGGVDAAGYSGDGRNGQTRTNTDGGSDE